MSTVDQTLTSITVSPAHGDLERERDRSSSPPRPRSVRQRPGHAAGLHLAWPAASAVSMPPASTRPRAIPAGPPHRQQRSGVGIGRSDVNLVNQAPIAPSPDRRFSSSRCRPVLLSWTLPCQARHRSCRLQPQAPTTPAVAATALARLPMLRPPFGQRSRRAADCRAAHARGNALSEHVGSAEPGAGHGPWRFPSRGGRLEAPGRRAGRRQAAQRAIVANARAN